MNIEYFYLQLLSYSKNPDKIEMVEYPDNFMDLHLGSIAYSIEENYKQKKPALIRIEVKTQPKSEEKGIFTYKAVYYAKVSDYGETSLDEMMKRILPRYWGRIHADYVRSLNDFRMPTYVFPAKPIYPSETQTENDDDQSPDGKK